MTDMTPFADWNESHWRLGDWAVYGEANYGERFYDAVHHNWVSPRLLADAMRTAEAFPADTRRDMVSWDIYRAVAKAKPEQSLPERLRWVALAEENRWGPSELKSAMQTEKADAS